jgi:hypothetical protein
MFYQFQVVRGDAAQLAGQRELRHLQMSTGIAH